MKCVNPKSVSNYDWSAPEREPLPRSRLICLEPIGMGTARVEGLVSYVIRLAREHSVNPRRLIRTEFVAARQEIGRLNRLSFFRSHARTVNGLGAYAELVCDAASALTRTANLRFLTLLPLRQLLPKIGEGLLDRNFKWCPDCFAQMVKSGKEPYRPLVWSFLHYRYCSIHRQRLVDRCPSCHTAPHFIPSYPSVCHCSRCGSWLGQASSGAPPTSDELWIAEAIEDVVSNLRRLETAASAANLLRAIGSIAERTTLGQRQAFCRAVGIEQSMLQKWIVGHKPTFPRWLTIAYALDTMPSTLLLSPDGRGVLAVPVVRKAPDVLCQRRAKTGLSAAERNRIINELGAIADDPEDHCSLSSIAKRVGWDVAGLRRMAPVSCNRIRDKYRLARKFAGEWSRAQYCKKLIHAMSDLIRRGEYPGGQELKRMLARQGMVLIPHYLKKVYMDVQAEWRKGEPPVLGTCKSHQSG